MFLELKERSAVNHFTAFNLIKTLISLRTIEPSQLLDIWAEFYIIEVSR